VGSEKRASFSVGALCGEPGGRAPLLGTVKALKTGVFSIGVSFWGTWGGGALSQGTSREG